MDWPSGARTTHSEMISQALAGSLSGIIETSFLYPLDLIKTRMQTIGLHAMYNSVIAGFQKIAAEEGMHRMYRGMPFPFLMTLPAYSVYSTIYELIRHRLPRGTKHGITVDVTGSVTEPSTGGVPGGAIGSAIVTREEGMYFLIAESIAGAGAAAGRDVFMNPADVIKQRMQVYGSRYNSSLSCLKLTLKNEGYLALYRSYPTQILIEAPYNAILCSSYVFFKKLLNPSGNFNNQVNAMSGVVSGCVSAAITAPLDVCRTLINTQHKSTIAILEKDKIKGLSQALVVVYKAHGFKGYARGLSARLWIHGTSNAITWSCYEYVKFTINKKLE